ncbi:MAG: imelysin family protein [Pseudomonadota bacterium]
MKSAVLALSLLLSGPVFAQATNWTEVNLALTDAVVIPDYTTFATAAAAMNEQATGFCSNVTPQSLAEIQAAFQTTMDGWQAVQHIQFGPITYFNWNYRLQYWPDDNGTGGRQLSALIAGKDSTVLSSENFARQSVGVQGLQALEMLLFDDKSLEELQADSYRCNLVQAIAANLDEIAAGVAQRWADEFRKTVETADERGFFESSEDATIDYLKALVEPIRSLQQQKIEAIIGESQAEARVRRAESWRSERSIRNLKIDVASLNRFFNAGNPALNTVLPPEDIEGINAGFAKVEATLAELPDSMTVALETESGYATLKQAASDLSALFELLEASLKKTDLYLGFNSLDGD